MSEETKTISARLREVLDRRGRSQQELADYLGTDRQHVNKWCMGRQQPNLKYVGDIARFLNLSTNELLSGKQQAHFNLDGDEFFRLELNALSDYIHLLDQEELSDERRKKILKRAKQSITFLLNEIEK